MKTYLDYFKELCQIPHGSGNTKAISDYCADFAKAHGFWYRQDEANNVVIVKEASAGREKDPGIMLQGHLDMVAVKDADLDFDFAKDPLKLRFEGDFLYATGTSLGGDDGIAVAMMLAALADDELSHPRLECVFTVDEEVGMDGAKALDTSDLTSKYMINLDCEEEGVFTVSCAGGGRVAFQLPVEKKKVTGELLQIEIGGLTGGHSGVEIHTGRNNAILLMGELLSQLAEKQDFSLASIKGGVADNAIPSSCMAEIIAGDGNAAGAALMELSRVQKTKTAKVDPGYFMKVENKGITDTEACDRESRSRLFTLLNLIPNGVQVMSPDIPGMVETSSNLGTIHMDDRGFQMICAPRSAKEEEKAALIKRFGEAAQRTGAGMEVSGEYPGWPVRKDSPLLSQMVDIFREMYHKEPRIEAVHAGLECGLFSQKMPELDIVACGPDMFDIHSPREHISISSAERTWKYLTELLKQIH